MSNIKLSGHRRAHGFTLMELVIVMTIIAILAAVTVPVYNTFINQAKATKLKQDLWAMRRAIENCTADKQRAPRDIQELVSMGYLREIPSDPFTKSADTWVPIQEQAPISPGAPTGIMDVRSGAEGADQDGKAFSEY
ncbi:MAG: type II secretion system protein [Blastocatellia bacterium]